MARVTAGQKESPAGEEKHYGGRQGDLDVVQGFFKGEGSGMLWGLEFYMIRLTQVFPCLLLLGEASCLAPDLSRTFYCACCHSRVGCVFLVHCCSQTSPMYSTLPCSIRRILNTGPTFPHTDFFFSPSLHPPRSWLILL